MRGSDEAAESVHQDSGVFDNETVLLVVELCIASDLHHLPKKSYLTAGGGGEGGGGEGRERGREGGREEAEEGREGECELEGGRLVSDIAHRGSGWGKEVSVEL